MTEDQYEEPGYMEIAMGVAKNCKLTQSAEKVSNRVPLLWVERPWNFIESLIRSLSNMKFAMNTKSFSHPKREVSNALLGILSKF